MNSLKETKPDKYRAFECGVMYNDLAYITMNGGGFVNKPYMPLINPTIMQSTLLNDSTGAVEMFSGDIIEFIYSPDVLKAKRIGYIAKDKYSNWCLLAPSLNELVFKIDEYHIGNAFDTGRVIGNIYEHPQKLGYALPE